MAAEAAVTCGSGLAPRGNPIPSSSTGGAEAAAHAGNDADRTEGRTTAAAPSPPLSLPTAPANSSTDKCGAASDAREGSDGARWWGVPSASPSLASLLLPSSSVRARLGAGGGTGTSGSTAPVSSGGGAVSGSLGRGTTGGDSPLPPPASPPSLGPDPRIGSR